MAATSKPGISNLEYLIKNIDNEINIKTVLLENPSISTESNLKILLNAAVEAGSGNTINILVTLGVKIDDVLKTAIKSKSHNIVKFSIENGANSQSSLDFAIKAGCVGILSTLLENGADINEALYYAVMANNKQIISFLLERGANISTNQRGGNTPLHVAVIRKSDLDLVSFLITKGAECDIRNKKGKTALDIVQMYLLENNDSVTQDRLKGIEIILQDKTNESGYDSLQGLPNTYCGILYQLKLCTLVAVRAMGSEFQLASEIVDAYPFDDIFLRIIKDGRTECLFLQAKYTNKPTQNKIGESELFTMFNSPFLLNSIKGDYALIKYLIHFYKISQGALCEGAILKHFTICTNTLISETASTYFNCEHLPEHDILYFKNSVCKKYKIREHYSDYFLMEVKFVLLNAFNENAIDLLDEKQRFDIYRQIELIKKIAKSIKEKPLHPNKDAETETLWNLKEIIKVGTKMNKLFLRQLHEHKIKLSKQCKESTELKNKNKKKVVTIDESIKKVKTIEELYAHLKNWDDDIVSECANNFIKQFSILSGSPDINKLDVIINQEVNSKMDVHDSSVVTDRIEKIVSNWFTSSRNRRAKFFTNSNMEKIRTFINYLKYTHMLNGDCKTYIDKLRQKNIHFESKHEQLMEFLTNDKKVVHMISENSQLSAMRVLQVVEGLATEKKHITDGFIFIKLHNGYISDQTLNNLKYAFASNTCHHLLIIEFSGEQQESDNFYKLFYEIRIVLKEHCDKKIIVIANTDNRLTIELKRVFKQYESFCDAISFRNLSRQTRENILDKTVCFQSNENRLKLRDFIDDTSACDIVDEDILSTIIKKQENIMIGSDEAFNFDGYNPELYVRRTIHYQVVNIDVFKSLHIKLFFVTGITKNNIIEKLKLKNENLIDYWDDNKSVKNGILLVPEITNTSPEEIFQRISKSSIRSIIWLDFLNGLFLWKGVKATHGNEDMYVSTRNISNHIAEQHSSPPDAIDQRMVIVTNHPGEGKSTMLIDLAHILRKKNSRLWIVRINLNEYAVDDQSSVTLKNIVFRDNKTVESIIFLSKMVIKGDSKEPKIRLQRKMFKLALKEDSIIKVILMFDGFDEISPGYKQNTCALIKALKESKVNQIWVTTRNHLKTYLEHQLQSPACMLTPLTEGQQIFFLNRFWKWSLKFCELETKSKNEVGTRIEYLNRWREQFELHSSHMSSDDPNSSIINEIIENLKKICTETNSTIEVLHKYISDNLHFECYANMLIKIWNASVHDGNKSFLNVPLNLRMLAENLYKRHLQIPKNIGLFEIYGQFIQDKLKIYQQKKSKMESGNEANKDQAKLVLQIIRNIHRELAVKKMFHPSCNLPNYDTINTYNITVEELTRIGLMKTQGIYFEFVHRSYAEYLFSEYLFVNIKNRDVQKEFLVKVLVDSSYPLIRYFFNAFLYLSEQKNKNLRPDDWPTPRKTVSAFVNGNERISECVYSDIVHDLITQRDYYKVNALSIAASEGHAAIFKFIWEMAENILNFVPNDLMMQTDYCRRTLLNRAVINGHTDLVTLILEIAKKNTNDLKLMLMQCDEHGKNALHLSIKQKHRHIFNIILETAQVHHEIITNLVTQCDHNGRTILHIVTITRFQEVFELILKSIKEYPDYLNRLILQCDHNGKTVLHVASIKRNQHVCHTILEILKPYSNALEFLLTQYDKDGQTALHIACLKNEKLICRMILESTRDHTKCAIKLITQCGKYGLTALCISESRGFHDIFNLILETAEKYPNCLNVLVSNIVPERRQRLSTVLAAKGFWKIHRYVKETFNVNRQTHDGIITSYDIFLSELAEDEQAIHTFVPPAYINLIKFIRDVFKKYPNVSDTKFINTDTVLMNVTKSAHAYQELYFKFEKPLIDSDVNLNSYANDMHLIIIRANNVYENICQLILEGPSQVADQLSRHRLISSSDFSNDKFSLKSIFPFDPI